MSNSEGWWHLQIELYSRFHALTSTPSVVCHWLEELIVHQLANIKWVSWRIHCSQFPFFTLQERNWLWGWSSDVGNLCGRAAGNGRSESWELRCKLGRVKQTELCESLIMSLPVIPTQRTLRSCTQHFTTTRITNTILNCTVASHNILYKDLAVAVLNRLIHKQQITYCD